MNNKTANNSKNKVTKIVKPAKVAKKNPKDPKKEAKMHNKEIGYIGETIACIYLEKRGYKIVERNYLKKYGELDIIALKDNTYCFVEVKSVTCEPQKYGNQGVTRITGFRPEDNVHALKIKKMGRIVEAYILEKKIFDYEWETKVMTVQLNMDTRRAKVDVIDIVL